MKVASLIIACFYLKPYFGIEFSETIFPKLKILLNAIIDYESIESFEFSVYSKKFKHFFHVFIGMVGVFSTLFID